MQGIDRYLNGIHIQVCFQAMGINVASAWVETKRATEIHRSWQTEECLHGRPNYSVIVNVEFKG